MERIQLTKETAITVDFERGEIANIMNNERQVNDGRVPMFSVKLRRKTGESRIVSSTECTFISFEENKALYTSAHFDIELLLKAENDSLIWRANIKNKTQDLLEWVELMSFSVLGKLKDEADGKGEIIYPYNEGCKVTNMAYRESMPFHYAEPDYPSKNSYAIFPNMISAQFIAYIAEGVGIYLGMHDSERTTKHIDFCYANEHIKVFMRAFCDVDYGQDYAMPFDSVLTVFNGDWYKAADIYRQWFTNNLPSGLQKIADNANLPAWYTEDSPLIVAYPLRGKHDVDMTNNGLYPYKNAIPFLTELAEETDGKVMALLMHWEGTAPWAPPYVWPPYGGEKEFASFVDELHNNDLLVGLYCSGLGWTQQSNIDADYRCEKQFEALHIAECLCADSNGAVKSNICSA